MPHVAFAMLPMTFTLTKSISIGVCNTQVSHQLRTCVVHLRWCYLRSVCLLGASSSLIELRYWDCLSYSLSCLHTELEWAHSLQRRYIGGGPCTLSVYTSKEKTTLYSLHMPPKLFRHLYIIISEFLPITSTFCFRETFALSSLAEFVRYETEYPR